MPWVAIISLTRSVHIIKLIKWLNLNTVNYEVSDTGRYICYCITCIVLLLLINDNCLLNLDSESGGAGAAGPSTRSNIILHRVK